MKTKLICERHGFDINKDSIPCPYQEDIEYCVECKKCIEVSAEIEETICFGCGCSADKCVCY